VSAKTRRRTDFNLFVERGSGTAADTQKARGKTSRDLNSGFGHSMESNFSLWPFRRHHQFANGSNTILN